MDNHLVNVFFRVDANRQIGTGHLVRCQILARKLKQIGMKCTFLLHKTPTFYEEKLKQEKFEVIYLSVLTMKYAENLSQLIHNHSHYPNNLLLIDSDEDFYYTAEFQEKIRFSRIKLMMITFRYREPFYADIIHNQNLLAFEYEYKTAPHTQRLFGTQYAILKEGYKTLNLSARRKVFREIKTLLINFGGADRSNQTYKTLKGIYDSGVALDRIVVVVGSLYIALDKLRDLIRNRSENNTSLHINTDRMPQFQYMADLAITSGGLTAWELACVKTPNFVIPTSEREIKSAEVMHRKKLVYYIGNGQEVSSNHIAQKLRFISTDFVNGNQMTERFFDLVASDGCDKVAEAIAKLFTTEIVSSRDKAL